MVETPNVNTQARVRVLSSRCVVTMDVLHICVHASSQVMMQFFINKNVPLIVTLTHSAARSVC